MFIDSLLRRLFHVRRSFMILMGGCILLLVLSIAFQQMHRAFSPEALQKHQRDMVEEHRARTGGNQ